MKIFLGTTKQVDFWPKERPLHLLGAWCWGGVQLPEGCSVLPYPWDDPAEFRKAACYVTDAYEVLLPRVAAAFNKTHGLNHSTQYWRYVIGPWLSWDLQVLYDHYFLLRRVLDNYGDLTTIGLSQSDYETPESMEQLCLSGYWDDRYKLQLFSQCLTSMNVPFETREFQGPAKPVLSFPKPSPLKRMILGVQESLARRARVAVVGTGLSPLASLKLFANSGFRIVPCNQLAPPRQPKSVDSSLRASLKVDTEALDEFQRIAATVLSTNVPFTYLENFETARNDVLARKSKPVTWLSGSSWYFDEAFKITVGESYERGSRILATQHGGYYGVLASNPVELDEQKFGTYFYTWGWQNALRNGTNLKPLPALKLAGRCAKSLAAKRRRNRCRFGDAVLITTSHPPHLLRFQSHPAGPQWERYFEAEIRFVTLLPETLRKKIIVRLHGVDYGWNRKERWRNAIPEIRFDAAARFTHHFTTAALLVIDHPATTFLEALAADIPTLLFWQPETFPLREGVSDKIDQLREAGILHSSPESAASAFPEIIRDAEAWWRAPERQRARENFCAEFAWTDKKWARLWTRELLAASAPKSFAPVKQVSATNPQ